MKRHEQIEICETCTYHRIIDGKGIICRMTNSVRTYDDFCNDFVFSSDLSQKEVDRFVEQQEMKGITVSENIKIMTTNGITEDTTGTLDYTDILEKYNTENWDWVKKSDEELHDEYLDKFSIISRLKKSITGGVIAFFMAVIIRVFMLLTIGPSISESTGPKSPGLPSNISLRELPDYWMNCLLLGLISFTVVFLFVFFEPLFKTKESLPTFICDKCKDKRIQKSIGEKCECGGVFYSSNDYKMEFKNNS